MPCDIPLALAVAGLEPARGMHQVRVQRIVQALVGAGLAHEDEVCPGVQHEAAEGLAAVQVVAQKDRSIGAQLGAVGGDPALGSVALAVLLAHRLSQFRLARGGVLLGLHERRHQGQDATVTVSDDGR